jgi:hypothetical protein
LNIFCFQSDRKYLRRKNTRILICQRKKSEKEGGKEGKKERERGRSRKVRKESSQRFHRRRMRNPKRRNLNVQSREKKGKN